ncbi:hypothetical protein EPUL_003208 [Erysiphe pulchra]|uniref:Uncharacterized protein n=1 Tax=Erysiphe pulchra TaxID=225359 RepID=A0A2S4PYG2_9PEZI|nr:hypothetical protein EPUL_003208 [Erysiphe pulchra]
MWTIPLMANYSNLLPFLRYPRSNIIYARTEESGLAEIDRKKLELVFEAVKTLAEQSVGNGTAASQLQNANEKSIEKEIELLAASSNLEVARRNIEALENSSENNSVYGKLANFLENLQLQTQRSANVWEGFIVMATKD